MHKTIRRFLLSALFSAVLVVSAGAEENVQISNLIDSAEDFDGCSVVVEGEAIGEILERGQYSWVNISDGTNAIGIWIKTSDAKTIAYFGDYKHIGDTVRIIGVFSKECREHGGEADIHCISIEIVRRGYTMNENVPYSKAVSSVILLFCAGLAAYICHKKVNSSERTD